MKERLTLLSVLFVLISAVSAWAQGRIVSGTVTDSGGEPLIGVSVLVKGTTTGTLTDLDGHYSIRVKDGDVLEFSYVGYSKKEVPVQGQSTIDVALNQGVLIDDVVVTAYGISREKKALGYSVAEISADDIEAARETNVLNALQGKVPGVTIFQGSGAPGAGSSINIRGIKSFGSSSPLVIVDGIPYSNDNVVVEMRPSIGSNAFNDAEQGATTNRLADINPADIESVNILKGAAATALYGSQAADGVIVITTKRGIAGRAKVDFSSSVGWDELGKRPRLQFMYREGRHGRLRFRSNGKPLRFQTLGPKVYEGKTPVFDPIADFFQTGLRTDNNISIRGGGDKATYFTSFGHYNQKGIIPFSTWAKTSVRVGGDVEVSPKLSVNGTFNYVHSGGNRPHVGDKSIMSALSYMTTSFDINDYINPDGTMKDYSDGIIDNPRYLAEFSTYKDNVNRINGNVGFNYDFTDRLNLEYVIGLDQYSDFRRRVVPPGLDVSSKVNGFIIDNTIGFQAVNSNLLLGYNVDINEDWDVRLTLGNAITSNRRSVLTMRGENFSVKTFEHLSGTSQISVGERYSRRRNVGVFGMLNIGYKDGLFLDLTGRVDKSSTLPKSNNTYFYPSVSFAFIPDEFVDMPDYVSFTKLRASYAVVGRDVGPHQIGRTYASLFDLPFNGQNAFTLSSFEGDPNLKPEFTSNIELGAEMRFFHNRLGFDFTWYKSHSTDLILPVRLSNTTGLSRYLTNAGAITNTGIEFVLNTRPIQNKTLSWDLDFNYSANKGTVDKIHDDVEAIILVDDRIDYKYVKGGRIGDLYGWKFLYDPQGNLIIKNGKPRVNFDSTVVVGNALPDFILSMTNGFNIGNFRISGLLEWKKGGDVYDKSFRNSYRNGVLYSTIRRYEQVVWDGVVENGNGEYEPNTNYSVLEPESVYRSGYFNNAAEIILEDASWVRLRKVSVSYRIPAKVLRMTKYISGATISLTGTNLFLNTPFRGFDPETNFLGSASSIRGYTGLKTPATKGYMLSLDLNF